VEEMITKAENLEVEGMDDRLISAGLQQSLDMVYFGLCTEIIWF